MKKSFLFKRGKYFHLQYEDEDNRLRRVSTKQTKRTAAIKFLVEFTKPEKAEVEPRKPNEMTLGTFKGTYLDFIKSRYSQKYYKSNKCSFKKLLDFHGDIPLNSICHPDMDRFLTDVFQKSKYSAKLHHRNLKGAFNRAIDWGYMQDNPLKKIRLPNIPQNNPLFINESELELILDKEPEEKFRNIYQFAFFTGMRLGEIANLKWDAVDLSGKIIRVLNTDSFTTKGKRERIIPINEKLYAVLSSHIPKIVRMNANNYVFNKKGFNYRGEYISKRFKEALRRTSLNPKLHFHNLRHSFASNLVMKGVSLYTVMELLGHKDFKTAQIYAHLNVDCLREAVKLLEN